MKLNREIISSLTGLFIGILGAFGGYFISTVVIEERAVLTVQFDSIKEIINISEAPMLKLLYRGQSLENLYSVDLFVINSGKKPIREIDIVKPVIVSLEGIERVVSLKEVEISQSSLVEDSMIQNNAILLNIKLLNPKDSVSLRILAEKTPNKDISAGVSGAIAGLEEIELKYEIDTQEKRTSEDYKAEIIRIILISIMTAMVAIIIPVIFLLIKKRRM